MVGAPPHHALWPSPSDRGSRLHRQSPSNQVQIGQAARAKVRYGGLAKNTDWLFVSPQDPLDH